MAEIPFEPYTGQGKLRFWCQKVLPLVYDDSLSYYELLGKVVEYLNNTIEDVSACEDNITALRDAFVQLQDYVNEVLEDFDAEVERVIDEMIDSGEFGEILSDVVNGLIASEYDETTPYVQFAYCLKDGKLYCATASTTGTWDETKWRETTVGNDMQLLSRRLYNLNAGQVSYDNTATYDDNTVGKKLKDIDDFDTNLNAGQVAYNPSETYNNSTVGKELTELKGSLNAITPFDTTPTSGSTKGVTSDGVFDFFRNAKLLNNYEDLDTLYGDGATGLYYVSTNVLNAPFRWSGLIVIGSGTSAGFQLMWQYYGAIAFRDHIGNPATWRDWTYLPQDPYPSINGEYNSNVNPTNARLYVNISNNIAIISGYFRLVNAFEYSGTALVIGNISAINRKIAANAFASSVGEGGSTTRILVATNGNIALERSTPATEWFSFTAAVPLRDRFM